MRVIPYLLYLFLAGLYVVVLRDWLTVFDAQLNIPALLVLTVSLYKKDEVAVWFGFFVGLVVAAGRPAHELGWYTLLVALIALAACYICERLNLDSLKAKLLLILGGVFVYGLVELLISGGEGFFLRIVTYALPSAIYTTLLGWIYFLVKEKRLTWTRFKALF